MCLDEIIQQAKEVGTWLANRQAAQKIEVAFGSQQAEPRIKVKVAFLSSFTVEPLVDFAVVEAAAQGIWLDAYVGRYGQFNQEILNPSSGLYAFSPEIIILAAEFDTLVNRTEGRLPANAAHQAMQEITSLAEAFKKQSKGILVVNTFMAAPQWPLHIVTSEMTKTMRDANQKLARAFMDDPNIQICDLDALASYHGYREALSPQMLHMARIPFSEGFLSLLARKIVSHIRAYKGLVRKCLVVDCDNTLWGGIVGEDGFEGIHLGPDSPGREYVDLQQAILELYHQGVILAINSKNNYDDVMKVLGEHLHMVLQENHFGSIQINWNDKPSNMRRIADELNIATDSFVFLDDDAAERAMMQQMLPEVYTIELPDNPSLYARALRESNEFVKAYLTKEDRKRGEMYAAQRQREKLQATAPRLEDFLRSLEMVVSIRPAKTADVKRVAQLTQRTNQFNLTTRRYSEADITAMLEAEDWRVYVLGLKDKFGDNGTVGIAIVDAGDTNWRIDTFLMSCRVIGRQVEDALVNRILKDAAEENIRTVQAEYICTAKNGLVTDFWKQIGFEAIEINEEHSRWELELSGFEPRTFEYLKIEK